MKESFVTIDPERCKGCRVCIPACPRNCIEQGADMNSYGFQYARFSRAGCIACSLCFYSCPEPGAITVYKDEERGVLQ